ncbi:hypothetical protein T484DRAFT_1757171 [Baffinella frigidus]|nr:hypothetical protein T484DRAFT_1757171 [Cryptophyta sp. CCMP2293]
MHKPPTTWKPELRGSMRAWQWQRAAGLNVDGSEKTRQQHAAKHRQLICLEIDDEVNQARNTNEEDRTGAQIKLVLKYGSSGKDTQKAVARRSAKAVEHRRIVDQAINTNEEDRTPAQVELLKKEDARKKLCNTKRKERSTIPAVRAKVLEQRRIVNEARNTNEEDRTQSQVELVLKYDAMILSQYKSAKVRGAIPAVRAKRKAVHDIYYARPEIRAQFSATGIRTNARRRQKKHANVERFIVDNGINMDTEPLSHKDAFDYVLAMMDDSDSVIGRRIFNTLGGMTLRTAFWDGNSNAAFYALSARGDADYGSSQAESIRFLVNNANDKYKSVLSQYGGTHFKYSDNAFKDLEYVYCPIRICSSWADCTKVEAALQLLFDFLPLGERRLWMRPGNGCSILRLRKCDMKYIKVSGDKSPKFMCGITVLKNVSVVERTIDANGNDIVVSITAGRGVHCTVNQPIVTVRHRNKEQRDALKATRITLGPHFMDKLAHWGDVGGIDVSCDESECDSDGDYSDSDSDGDYSDDEMSEESVEGVWDESECDSDGDYSDDEMSEEPVEGVCEM